MPNVHTVGMRKVTALYNEAPYIATPVGKDKVSHTACGIPSTTLMITHHTYIMYMTAATSDRKLKS